MKRIGFISLIPIGIVCILITLSISAITYPEKIGWDRIDYSTSGHNNLLVYGNIYEYTNTSLGSPNSITAYVYVGNNDVTMMGCLYIRTDTNEYDLVATTKTRHLNDLLTWQWVTVNFSCPCDVYLQTGETYFIGINSGSPPILHPVFLSTPDPTRLGRFAYPDNTFPDSMTLQRAWNNRQTTIYMNYTLEV